MNIDHIGGGELLTQFDAVAQEPVIGLAVSGGADSLALMVLAQKWASHRDIRPRLLVYSVDHGLRPEAADEVARVLAVAKMLHLEARGLRWEEEKPAAGIQAMARQARYRLIGEAMQQDGATVLLMAHHRQDQAETVLMRLAHGSGIGGLGGIRSFSVVEGVRVYRPLLDVEPELLRTIVDAAGLVPTEDSSNHDRQYERVRWRQMLPQLAAMGLDNKTLSCFAGRMADAEAALSSMAVRSMDEIVRIDRLCSARIDLALFQDLAPAIATRLLGRVLQRVGGARNPRALGQVERLVQMITQDRVNGATTLLGCIIRTGHGQIMVTREPGRSLPEAIPLVPQAALLWDNRFQIINRGQDKLVVRANSLKSRVQAENLVGCKLDAPREALRAAPIVQDEVGNILSLGTWSFDLRVSVQLADCGYAGVTLMPNPNAH